MPWEQVPDLVSTRRVFLKQGTAYVHKREMGSVVVSHFKSHLSKALALTARKWASHCAAEDESRLGPIVDSLSLRYTSPCLLLRLASLGRGPSLVRNQSRLILGSEGAW